MKSFAWDKVKNEWLKRERGISFEEIIFHINHGDLLARLDHPNQKKYAHQMVFIVLIDGYAYMVPYVESKEEYFLKTAIPSRKLKREYVSRKR